MAGGDRWGVTRREAEVLAAVARRMSNAEIAGALCISVRTVESHVSSLLAKLNAENRGALMSLAPAVIAAAGDSGLGAPASAQRTPLAGRDGELARLAAIAGVAFGSQGRLVLLAGEPGVGKTRLTEELGAEARRHGALVLVGSCYEAEGTPPYSPFVEVCERALAANPEGFRAALADDAPEIARLVPGVRRRFPDIGAPLELPAEQARHYLFSSVRDTIARQARTLPLVLVLEDLHWGDESTLLLLEHLAEHVAGLPLLLVGTYRDSEIGIRPLLARTVEDLVRRRLVEQVKVAPLPEAAVGDMIGSLAGQPPPEAVLRLLHQETQGNPFFVEEMFRFLDGEGRLFDADGRFRAEVSLGRVDVPENVRLVIGRRLDRLSDNARRVLAMAAIIGRFFDYPVLELAAGVSADAVLDGLEEAERARLIGPLPGDDTGDRFGFVHELVRQTLLATISGPRRHRLHRAAADAIEEAFALTLDDHLADLAHHLTEAAGAAEPARVFEVLIRAGRAALVACAFGEALGFLEAAREREGAVDERRRAELWIDLATAYRRLGHHDQFVTAATASLELFERVGDKRAVAGVCTQLTQAFGWATRWDDALAMADRGLAAIGDAATPERGHLLAKKGMVFGTNGQYDAAIALLAEAIALGEKLGDTRLTATALGDKTFAVYSFMQHDAAVDCSRAAFPLLRQVDDLWEAVLALAFRMISFVHLGRFAEVVELRAEIPPLAGKISHWPGLMVHNRGCLMLDFFSTGDLARLEAAARADLDLSEKFGTEYAAHGPMWLALAELLRGRLPQALQLAQQGLDAEPAGSFLGIGWELAMLCHAHAGRRREALALFEEHRSELAQAGEPSTWGSWSWLTGAVDALALLGEDDEAAALYPAVADGLGRGAVLGSYLRGVVLERIAGVAAAAARDWGAAEAHFRRAVTIADTLPHPLEAAETRHWHGRMLLAWRRPGDDDDAARLLAEAAAAYRRLGMPRHAALAEAPG